MFKDIKTRKKPFVILRLLLFFVGLIFGGVSVYFDNTLYLGWMFWLVSGAFLLRALEVFLVEKQKSIGYLLIGIVYLCFSLFFYPIW